MGYGVRGAMYLAVLALGFIAYLMTEGEGKPSFDVTERVDYVADGATFRMGETWIRLHGIDAPEKKQKCSHSGSPWPCGLEATRVLENRILGKTVSCAYTGRERYGSVIGICYWDGFDISAWLVDEGWAVAYRQYSSDYDEEELRAKMARRGLWRGSFEMPELWRRARR